MDNNKERKMAKVVIQLKMDDEDKMDVLFWLSKTSAERRNYFTWLNGSFPNKIVKVVTKKPL